MHMFMNFDTSCRVAFVSTWGSFQVCDSYITCYVIARLAVWWFHIFSSKKKKRKLTGGYLIARFKSGMNIAYALGWKASKRMKIPPVECGKWRQAAGARCGVRDTVIGANNSWSFTAALNFYCTVVNISWKQLAISFICFLPSAHLMFKSETLLNAKCY